MSMFLQMGQLWNIVMVSTIMKITVTRDIVTDRTGTRTAMPIQKLY